MEERAGVDPRAAELAKGLVHDDSDRIIQNALAEDDAVGLWIDPVLLGDDQDLDGVCRAQRRAKYRPFYGAKVENFNAEHRPDVHEDFTTAMSAWNTYPSPTARKKVSRQK